MLWLSVQGVDITGEIPLKYWVVFAIVLSAVMYLVKKFLTKLFIPQREGEEALIWSVKSGRHGKKGK